jgi:hypothetical protein
MGDSTRMPVGSGTVGCDTRSATVAQQPISKKAAPRREVVRIDRTGSWGRVEYEHHLVCGHVERRKRIAPTSEIACTGCVLAEKHQKNLAEQVDNSELDEHSSILDQLAHQVAMSEREAAIIKAALVSKFRVMPEAVDVVLEDDDGTLNLSYAVILLSADEIRQILSVS